MRTVPLAIGIMHPLSLVPVEWIRLVETNDSTPCVFYFVFHYHDFLRAFSGLNTQPNKQTNKNMSQRSIKASAQVAIVIIIWYRGTLAVWNTTNHEHWHVYEHVSTQYAFTFPRSSSCWFVTFLSLHIQLYRHGLFLSCEYIELFTHATPVCMIPRCNIPLSCVIWLANGNALSQSSGAVWKSRWTSWAPRP